MSRLNEILPANRQVVSDGGHFIGWTSYYFDLPAPDSLTMVGTQFQSIGLGLPSATGAALARPGATTIVATGDGGGIMGLPDLDSLVRTAESAVVLVFNDACYGAEIHQYGSQGMDQRIMEIEQADFAKLAEGFGATGLVVNTMEDLDAVQDWVDNGATGTLVVDLRISRNVIAPYILEIIELTLKKN
jgi:thiamine pyrophosphate-dependent acetolactate synthase large subunit-like protein